MVRVSQRRVRHAAGCRIYQDPSVTFPSGVVEVLNISVIVSGVGYVKYVSSPSSGSPAPFPHPTARPALGWLRGREFFGCCSSAWDLQHLPDGEFPRSLPTQMQLKGTNPK